MGNVAWITSALGSFGLMAESLVPQFWLGLFIFSGSMLILVYRNYWDILLTNGFVVISTYLIAMSMVVAFFVSSAVLLD